jgi:diadenosine tetraphosphate (Ap4A) HIT family hydrolase
MLQAIDCPFCHPRAERLAESDRLAYATPDDHPVSPGHTLVIARRHVQNPFDLTVEEIQAVFHLARSVRARLDAGFQPDGYNIGFNVGRAAGQTIDHVHMHVIPRYREDVADPTGGIRNVLPGKGPY